MDVMTLKRETFLDRCKERLRELGFVWETDSPFSGYFYLPYKDQRIRAGFRVHVVDSFKIFIGTLIIQDLTKKAGQSFADLDATKFLGAGNFREKLRFSWLEGNKKGHRFYSRRIVADPKLLTEKLDQLRQLPGVVLTSEKEEDY